MKKLQKLVVLLAVLVVLVGAYFAVTYFTKDPEPIDIEEIAVFTAQPDTLSSLSWDYQGQTVTINQTEAGWVVDGQDQFPLDQGLPKVMASRLQKLVGLSTLTEFDPDPKTYGLDQPELTIRIAQTDGNTTTLSIGTYSTAVGGYYLKSDKAPDKLYIVEESLLTAFRYGLYDLVQKESLPTMSSIVGLDVQDGAAQFSVRYVEDNEDLAYTDQYSWFLVGPDGTYSIASINKVVELGSGVAGLSWQKCVAYQAANDELAAYGLDDASAARVTLTYLDDLGQEDEITLLFGSYDGASCYARLQDSSMVYLVDAAIVDPLLTANAASVAPNDVCLMNWDSVDSMDVSLDGKTYTVVFEGNQKLTAIDGETAEQAVYTCNGQTLDSTAMQSLLDSIYAMKSTETVTESASGRGEAISFTFHRNTKTYAEMTLTFYQYNSASYLVTFTDQPTRLVDSASVSTMLTHAKTIFSAVP